MSLLNHVTQTYINVFKECYEKGILCRCLHKKHNEVCEHKEETEQPIEYAKTVDCKCPKFIPADEGIFHDGLAKLLNRLYPQKK
jgi:hypothetical protein